VSWWGRRREARHRREGRIDRAGIAADPHTASRVAGEAAATNGGAPHLALTGMTGKT
jgi:hypothetical protein